MQTEQIISGCKKGDPLAREALYNLYAARVYALCCRYVDSADIAQDLMHDSFLVIFTTIDSLKDTGKLESWMFTIVKHLAVDYYREKKKAVESMSTSEVDALPDSAAEDLPSFLELKELIDRLPKQYGQVFKLSALQGLSHKEISKILNIAEHTSSSDFYRARILLKKALLKYWMTVPVFLLFTVLLFSPKRKEKTTAVSDHIEYLETEIIQTDSIIERVALPVANYPPKTASAAPAEVLDTIFVVHAKREDAEENIVPQRDSVPTETAAREKIFDNIWMRDVAAPVKKHKGKPAILVTGNLLSGASATSNANLIPGMAVIPETWADYKALLDGQLFDGEWDDRTLSIYQIADYNENSKEPVSKSKRKFAAPVSLGIKADIPLYAGWYLRTGLEYTRLGSSLKTGTRNAYIQENQSIHYLGLPVGLSYELWNTGRLDIVPSVDVMTELPIKGTTLEKHILHNKVSYRSKNSLHAPVQISAGIGLGIQYYVKSNLGLYAEPRLRYYFKPGDNLETIRTAHPLQPNLSVGIKLYL